MKYFDEDTNKYFHEFNDKYFGGALVEFKDTGERIIGRDKELHSLSILMERPDNPVAILLADAGVGKTALVKSWIDMRQEEGKKYLLYEVEIGALSVSDTGDSSSVYLQRLERMIPNAERLQHYLNTEGGEPDAEIVLFIDEAHNIITNAGQGTKVGGDMLKRSLVGSNMKMILATTNNEFQTYFSADEAFDRRLTPLRLPELDNETTKIILKSWLLSKVRDSEKEKVENIDEDVFDYITKMSALHVEDKSEPAKSINIVETMVAMHRVDGDELDKALVDRVFREQYGVILDFRHNIKKVLENLKDRVLGQPLMLFTMDKILKKMALPLEPSNKPLATILMIGTTGVGKTETSKALTEGLYKDENRMINFNMSDYSDPKSEQRFRNELGQKIKQNASAIVLLDEVEKASDNVILTLLPILDEGRVVFQQVGQDGVEVSQRASLRNAIIIATTNAGSTAIGQLDMYSRVDVDKKGSLSDFNKLTDKDRREWEQQEPIVREALISSNLRPELLGRFQDIVPFGVLSEPVKLEIIEKIISKNIRLLNEYHGIEIELPEPQWGQFGYEHLFGTPVSMFIAVESGGGDDADSGGARKLQRDIERHFMTPIRDAIFNNPSITRFLVDTNGRTRFESKDAYDEGALVVNPLGISVGSSDEETVDEKRNRNKQRGAISLG